MCACIIYIKYTQDHTIISIEREIESNQLNVEGKQGPRNEVTLPMAYNDHKHREHSTHCSLILVLLGSMVAGKGNQIGRQKKVTKREEKSEGRRTRKIYQWDSLPMCAPTQVSEGGFKAAKT